MISKKMNEQILGGSLIHQKNYLAGLYKGYYITIDDRKSVYIVFIHATFDDWKKKFEFESFIESYKKTAPHVSKAEAKDHAIKLRIVKPQEQELTPSVLNETIEPIISKLLDCGYETGCIDCGDNEVKIDCYNISGYYQFLCEHCVAGISENYKLIRAMMEKRYENPPAYNYTIKKMNLDKKLGLR